jgi:hypothetical protein
MLSKHCKIDHLNLAQWRRLSQLAFGNRNPTRVYLLHDKGAPLRLWKAGAGDLPFSKERITDFQAAADTLKAGHPDAYEAWVLDPEHFSRAMSQFQASAAVRADLDEFALADFDARLAAEGHAVSPKRDLIWRGVPIRRVRRFVEKMLPDSCTFVLGVFDGDELWASLLLQFQDKQLVAASTTDALPPEDVKDIVGRDQHPFFLSVVANAFHRPAFGWFVERAEFEAWMQAIDEDAKEEIFQRAIMQQKATFDFSILVDRGITALSPINPGEAAVAGQDREQNPRTRTPDPADPGPSAA